MGCPAALAAEKQRISDKRPDRIGVAPLYDLAEVLLIVTVIAALAWLIMCLSHIGLRIARNEIFHGIIMQKHH